MIFKKPYGFLIKHFRLIHLILTALYIIILIKTNNLLNFYNEFLAGTETKLNAIKYVNSYYLVAVVLAAIICIVVSILMHYKKKPKLLYIVLISLYAVVTLIINLSCRQLQNVYISSLSSTKDLLLYRDLLNIIIKFQYISIIFTVIRGLGFDIKKFNFKEDIAELNLDVTDDEEIELTVGNTEGLKRRIRRQSREFIYYYKENKMFINTILLISILTIVSYAILNVKIINKEFVEGNPVDTDQYSFTVNKSYLTTKSYDGSIITDENTIMLLTKITISSKVGPKKLNNSIIQLETASGSYSLNSRYSNYFKDLGTVYNDHTIYAPKTYLFMYVINAKDVGKKMQIKYANDRVINLNPINLDKISQETTIKLGEPINFSKTVLENGVFTINKYDVKNRYAYDYEYEANEKKYHSTINIVSPAKTILYLNLTYQCSLNISNYEFLSNYGVLKYKLNNNEYSMPINTNKTPASEANDLYLEVDKEIEKASNIWIELNIRNQKIIYTLK